MIVIKYQNHQVLHLNLNQVKCIHNIKRKKPHFKVIVKRKKAILRKNNYIMIGDKLNFKISIVMIPLKIEMRLLRLLNKELYKQKIT